MNKNSSSSPVIFEREFHWPAGLEILREIRLCLESFLVDYDLSKEELNKIELSVDEACANVVQHAYCETENENDNNCATGRVKVIDMRLRLAENHILIEVSDQGRGMRHGPHQGARDLNEYAAQSKPHGLGISIIRQCMDEVDLSYSPEAGTRLAMLKYIRKPD